jgi:hypothetical protein
MLLKLHVSHNVVELAFLGEMVIVMVMGRRQRSGAKDIARGVA